MKVVGTMNDTFTVNCHDWEAVLQKLDEIKEAIDLFRSGVAGRIIIKMI